MTTILFQLWLVDFNEMVAAQNKRVLLLLDDAPTHKTAVCTNVTVLFLPPNSTSASKGTIKKYSEGTLWTKLIIPHY